jgi:hypothetical protein
VSANVDTDPLQPPGSFLFHYTRLSTAVEEILLNWSLRMSPFSQMRDPRESQLLPIEGIVGYVADETRVRDQLAQFAELDRGAKDLKDRVKVLAFTQDDARERDEASAVFGRGYAHPRLWEQYAESHRGICLRIDQAELIKTATHNLRHKGELAHDPVTYIDADLAPHAREVIMSNFQDRPVAEVLDQHVKTHLHEIFFTKLRDWESEMEYRLILVTDNNEPAYVGIESSLRALVLGERVSDTYLPSIQALCRERDIAIYKVRWPYGRPRLERKGSV